MKGKGAGVVRAGCGCGAGACSRTPATRRQHLRWPGPPWHAKKDREISVLTRNLYLGTDLIKIASAPTIDGNNIITGNDFPRLVYRDEVASISIND